MSVWFEPTVSIECWVSTLSSFFVTNAIRCYRISSPSYHTILSSYDSYRPCVLLALNLMNVESILAPNSSTFSSCAIGRAASYSPIDNENYIDHTGFLLPEFTRFALSFFFYFLIWRLITDTWIWNTIDTSSKITKTNWKLFLYEKIFRLNVLLRDVSLTFYDHESFNFDDRRRRSANLFLRTHRMKIERHIILVSEIRHIMMLCG